MANVVTMSSKHQKLPWENNRLKSMLKTILNSYYENKCPIDLIQFDWESFGYSSIESAYYTLQQCIRREKFPLHIFRKQGNIYIEIMKEESK